MALSFVQKKKKRFCGSCKEFSWKLYHFFSGEMEAFPLTSSIYHSSPPLTTIIWVWILVRFPKSRLVLDFSVQNCLLI